MRNGNINAKGKGKTNYHTMEKLAEENNRKKNERNGKTWAIFTNAVKS